MNRPGRYFYTKFRAALLLCLAMFTLTGCPPSTPQPVPPTDAAGAPNAWRAFLTLSGRAAAIKGPYRLNASLRYDNNREAHRVSAYIWGNGDQAASGGVSPYPIRLDILSGVGMTVAKVREDESAILTYDPSENVAYKYTDEGRALVNFGVPLPFTLHDLVMILTGRYEEFFMPYSKRDGALAMPEAPRPSADGNLIFRLQPGQLPGELELTPEGLPVRWSEFPEENDKNLQGWTMRIFYDKNALASFNYGPLRVQMNHPKGYEAVITVKERARPDKPFTHEQLDLKLPKNATLKAVSTQQ